MAPAQVTYRVTIPGGDAEAIADHVQWLTDLKNGEIAFRTVEQYLTTVAQSIATAIRESRAVTDPPAGCPAIVLRIEERKKPRIRR